MIPLCKTYGQDWQETSTCVWEIGANFLSCADVGDSFYFTDNNCPDPGQYIFCAREGTVNISHGSNLQDLGPC
jgi:hypothetical protein